MEEVKLEVFEQELQKYFHTTNCHSQSNLNVQDELQSQLGQDHASYMTQSHVNQSHHHRPSQTRSHLTDATAREPYPNESLIETLSQAIGASRLPVSEPPVFTGDPLLYPDWKASFSALIEGKGIPASDKIHYLKRYLGGPAREAVSGFFLLGSEKAYQQAKDILDQRFGNQFITSDAFMSKLNSWPKVQNKDKSALQRFSDFLVQCQAAQHEFPILRSLDDIREIQKIAQKLLDWASTSWNRVVAMKRKDKGRYPTFPEFSSFVKDEADIANDPALLSGPQILQSVTNRQDKGESVNKRVFFTNGDLSQDCKFCKRKNHNLADCRSFARKNMEERREFVMKERLCFGCLIPGHMSKQCRNRSECSTCNKRHPTSLHNDTRQTEPKPPREEGNRGSLRVLSGQKHGSLTSMIIPVFLSSKSNPQKEQLVYALVDTMSDSTFVTENVVNDLQAPCKPAKLRLTTLTNNSALITCKKFTDLQVRGFHSRTVVDLPESFSRDHIPVDETHIPTPETASCWPHLFGVKDMLTPKLDCPIGLLIGYNCPQALAPLQCITGDARQPFAIETCLGWSVIDVYKTQVQEVTTGELLHLMERDVTDHDTQKMSQDDHLFGATSSPGCANFGLKQIAKDNRHLSERATDFLDRDFYVDGLRAEETVMEAKEVISNARSICAKANLRLHKMASNSKEVIQNIPESERASQNQTNVGIDNGSESTESTLGLRWNTIDDTLRFKLRLKEKPLPLTPNHILTMKSGLIMPPPPGHFVKEDLYLNKRWKRVQFLADRFWTRWKKEYLQSLQRRSKWQQRQPNIVVNGIVLLQDEGDCRTDWKIARVVETFPGKDGLIRTVTLLMSTSALDKLGKSTQKRTLLDRAIHKLVVLIKGEQVISD
ncbi:uncharacterized protein [Littorina saxatilis]|uniref:uncharacterized protein n=1 Tax=Littorina saxatilis TaxID=31220 RepID=UPI0038B5399B